MPTRSPTTSRPLAFAVVAVDLAREQLGGGLRLDGRVSRPCRGPRSPTAPTLRALDAQRRSARALGLDDQAARSSPPSSRRPTPRCRPASRRSSRRPSSAHCGTIILPPPLFFFFFFFFFRSHPSPGSTRDRSKHAPPLFFFFFFFFFFLARRRTHRADAAAIYYSLSFGVLRTDMPAVVLIGAQWGDEGKGKADLLGSRLDYVVKFNGGNNAGHTVVIGDEKYACTYCLGHPHAGSHAGDRQRRRGRHRGALRGARGARGPRRGHLAARDLGERARDHASTTARSTRCRGVPRQAADRHDRPRHRPGVRRQDQPRRHPLAGPLRREHPAAEGRGRSSTRRTTCS